MMSVFLPVFMKPLLNLFSSVNRHTPPSRWSGTSQGSSSGATGCTRSCKIAAFSSAVIQSCRAIMGSNDTQQMTAPILQLWCHVKQSATHCVLKASFCIPQNGRMKDDSLLVIASCCCSGSRLAADWLYAFICWPWLQCVNNSLARNTGFVRSRMSRRCLLNTVVLLEALECLSTLVFHAALILLSADTILPLCLVIQSTGKVKY